MTNSESQTINPPPLSLEGTGKTYDVMVVGGGAAGLYSALCLPETLQVALVTKDNLNISASDWAQGGIAAALSPEDSSDLHVADTLRAGAGLCEAEAVKLLVEEARPCIEALISLGVAFDRQGEALAMTLEAAHSRKRVLHAADTTGHAIVSILAQQVLARPNIEVFESAFVLDLWVEEGICKGLCLAQSTSEPISPAATALPDAQLHGSASNQEHARIRWVPARAVVLAAGGGGQVYAQTTNPDASTGDGVAMAWRAGAQVRDLEFFQFHPTALTEPGAPRFLISEAVRGEGAHLLDAQGCRFAFDYHPDGELAPRDVVSRAIFLHLRKSSDGKSAKALSLERVWLDLSPIEPERIRHRFPNIIQVCKHWGIDIFHQPIPVAPAAHYWMGGITCGLDSQTTVKYLYAVGENASTGVHGANRLASNSLLECLVYGSQLRHIQLAPQTAPVAPIACESVDLSDEWLKQLTHWRTHLPQLLWAAAGISREKDSMVQALETLCWWQQEFEQLSLSRALTLDIGEIRALPETVTFDHIRLWGEVKNLLAIAALILKSALFRTESRGGHYRSDYPTPQAEWHCHTLIEGDRCWRSKPIDIPTDISSPLPLGTDAQTP